MNTEYKRSPFCLLHWDGPDLYARNCNSHRLFRIAERYVTVLHGLSDWTTVTKLAGALSIEETRLELALDRLLEMGLVITHPPGPGDEMPGGEGETSWDLIDLAFQRRTSAGGYDPLVPKPTAPAPAFKPPVPSASVIELSRSGLDDSWSLRAVLDGRRSVREYSDGPMGLDVLSRFLYAAARVVQASSDPALGDMSHRPSPSAGARHPLELYLLCNDVADLAPGAYHYDPRGHALSLVKPSDAEQELITRQARASTGDVPDRDPHVVILVTAVFQRTMWKYENIALALILKDVGALYQTMYLVATALGLAPCGLGGWMEKRNAEWLGLDPLVESQVGSFLLGAARDGPAA